MKIGPFRATNKISNRELELIRRSPYLESWQDLILLNVSLEVAEQCSEEILQKVPVSLLEVGSCERVDSIREGLDRTIRMFRTYLEFQIREKEKIL